MKHKNGKKSNHLFKIAEETDQINLMQHTEKIGLILNYFAILIIINHHRRYFLVPPLVEVIEWISYDFFL